MTILALGFDLFFKPRLMDAAKAAGAEITFASPAEAAEHAADAERVIADVSAPGVLEALEAVRKAAPDVPILACYPHVQKDLAERAEGLGARTLPRSQFNQRLGDAVAGRL